MSKRPPFGHSSENPYWKLRNADAQAQAENDAKFARKTQGMAPNQRAAYVQELLARQEKAEAKALRDELELEREQERRQERDRERDGRGASGRKPRSGPSKSRRDDTIGSSRHTNTKEK